MPLQTMERQRLSANLNWEALNKKDHWQKCDQTMKSSQQPQKAQKELKQNRKEYAEPSQEAGRQGQGALEV